MPTAPRRIRTTRMPKYSSRIADLAVERACAQARDSFWDFRRLMRPELIQGWWLEDLAGHLQKFYQDLEAGRRPKMAIKAPPQHGKSLSVTDFTAWVAGKNPNLKTIFASFSEDLGERTNLDLQRCMLGPRYAATFGRTRIGASGWQCNSSLIEYADHKGSFRNTTVLGQVNGQELNLGVIDDPVKGQLEANSKLIRDKTWDWFNHDFMSRGAAKSGILVIMTRWHVDDLLGRALEKYPEFKIVRYPAIAEEDELHRRKGEPLFPELKPLDYLLSRKNALPRHSWESLYQQNPVIVGGGQLPIEKLIVLPHSVDRSKIVASVRYWDKAGSTGEDAAFTAGVLMHKLNDGTFVIEDIARGRWSALDREQRIKMLAQRDSQSCKNLTVWIEQEPGSGGKESAENTLRNLLGFNCYADKVTGSKQVRAEPFVAQVQAGNIHLVAGGWVQDFWDECEPWPHGRFNDQVDAAAGAFNKHVNGPGYNLDYKQWAY
jgi:predicted phage terminase large subunit-like protein